MVRIRGQLEENPVQRNPVTERSEVRRQLEGGWFRYRGVGSGGIRSGSGIGSGVELWAFVGWWIRRRHRQDRTGQGN